MKRTLTTSPNSDQAVRVQACNSDAQAFSSRVALICDQMGSASAVARAMNVSEAVVRKWRDGLSDPSRKNLAALARVANVDLVWLATGTGEQRIASGTGVATSAVTMVPRYNLKFGAGPGRPTWEIEQVGERGFTHEWLRRKGIKPENAGVAPVSGPSMEPKLCDGDDVLFDRGDCLVRSGKCYGLRVGQDFLIKYLSTLPDGTLSAASENPRFEAFRIPVDADVQVIGRIRSSSREWD